MPIKTTDGYKKLLSIVSTIINHRSLYEFAIMNKVGFESFSCKHEQYKRNYVSIY